MEEGHVTIPERVHDAESQIATLAACVNNLAGICGGLTALVADLRHQLSGGGFDPSLPDIEKDLKAIADRIDKTWPELPPPDWA